MIGALDRLLVLYAAEEGRPEASMRTRTADISVHSPEVRKCTRQLAECIVTLRDVTRAPEVKCLLPSGL